jgi:hypothetical protein
MYPNLISDLSKDTLYELLYIYISSKDKATFYMQERGFDSWTLHLFILWVNFQATRLPDKKEAKIKQVVSKA